MKIVYIYHSLAIVGGIERVIVDKANYFAEKYGHEIYIITTDQGSHPVVYSLHKNIQHIDLNICFHRIYKYPFIKREIERLIKNYKFRIELTKLLKVINPDFTICTTNNLKYFITSITDSSIKIIESHGAKEFNGNQYIYRKRNIFFKLAADFLDWKMHYIIKKYSALIVLTNNDSICWNKIKKATVIPNSLPFYPEKISTLNNKKIISIGRLEEQKGYDLLIQTWKIVVEKHPEWSLHIYGNGSLKNTLKEFINKEGLNDSFIIENPVSDIYNKYVESSIYVMSSRYEGFGMVLIEAMACGIPVVSFDCPNGPSDIITDGEDGFLVKNKDIEALAEKICYLIENENTRIEMGKKAHENVKRYMPDIIMKKWIDLFNSLKQNNQNV
ncbi:glycosyltransferase family 4 protein [uncultured Bacteroides sp.]|uniref:glycosyltransferase family 4 protein n=1 Tax=uncultured Bacteroides sp. TaxID=162156 RepID=UPI002AAAA4B5|nr:glycosyltransferase family 4 protein [uncultured Bacteroides sp.]